MPLGRPARWLLVAAGSLSLALGVVGIFLPLLPTTPFLVLAAALYMRSSERLYARLMSTRWLGDYIRNYREKRGMTLRHKVFTLALLWLTIAGSAALATDRLAVRLALGAVAVAVTVHIVLLRTFRSPRRPPG